MFIKLLSNERGIKIIKPRRNKYVFFVEFTYYEIVMKLYIK